MISASNALALLAVAAPAYGAVHTVMVGKGGLKFVPDSMTAAVGDSVEFEFATDGHSVAQGSFDKACTPSGSDAFYSGFVSPGGKPFTIEIKNTDPIWLYCTQVSHCQSGMVGVINPPSGKTVDDYSTAAGNTEKSEAPGSVGGGTFGPPPAMSSMMSSMMPAMTSSMMPSQTMESSMASMMSTMSSEMPAMSSAMSSAMESGSMMSSASGMESSMATMSSAMASSTAPAQNNAGRIGAGLGAVVAAGAAFVL